MRSQQQDQVPLEILLIEDDLAHAELIVRSFEDHPIANRIHHLADGEAALDYLFHRGDSEGGARPHMVLLDLRLPKVDGLEVLRRIRSQPELDRMPVVVLTTSRAETDVESAYRHHANSYLVKPLDFPTFSKMMDDIGYYWLGWNHHPDRAPGYWL
jgi:CheY-like chemotaxis protein